MWLLFPFSLPYLLAEALKGLKQLAGTAITQIVIMPGASFMVFWVGGLWHAWSLSEVIGSMSSLPALPPFMAGGDGRPGWHGVMCFGCESRSSCGWFSSSWQLPAD